MPREKPPLPKSQWGPGPWQEEPDRLHFEHAGLGCYIFRNTWVTGALNGYVSIPPEHPWWGKDYRECVATPQCAPEPSPDFEKWAKDGWGKLVPPAGSNMRASMMEPRWHCDHTPDSILEVHGGITYSGPIVAGIDPEHVGFGWGFGFDTAHCDDLSPMMEATLRHIYLSKPGGKVEWAAHEQLFKEGPMPQSYKDLTYVRAEVERLAEQLALVRQTTNVKGDTA